MAARFVTSAGKLARKEALARSLLQHTFHTYSRNQLLSVRAACAVRPVVFTDLRSCHTSKVRTKSKSQYHTSSARQVSTSNSTVGPDLSSENLIESWYHEVKTFGTLTVHEVPFEFYIQPLNPMEYPVMNKSIVQVFYDTRQVSGGGPLPGQKLGEMSKLYDLKVKVDDEGEKMDVNCDLPAGVHLPLVCIISVPMKYVVNVKGKRGHNVIISGLESEKVKIHLEKGSCRLHGVKSGTVNIQCDDGSITCKQPLLGNITMQCRGNGSIEGDRFQGTTVDCCTAQGHIKVGMLYAERSRFISHTGDLQLGGCHGRMTAKSEGGNLTVDSLDGSLSVELGTGSADVCVARQEGVGIDTMKGDVILRFSPDYSCSLDLGAIKIEKDESLSVNLDAEGRGFLKYETDAKVKVAAPSGKISLKSQDWLASLKLQFTSSSPDRLQDFK